MLNPPLMDIWIILALVLLALLGVANFYFRNYFLGIIMIGILTWYALVGYVGLEFLENPHFAFLAFLFAKPYLIFLLFLGIHCIKENYKFLGILILVATIFYTYIALIKNYIITSVIFLLFGVGLLYYSRRINAKKFKMKWLFLLVCCSLP